MRGLGAESTAVQADETLEDSPGRVFHIQRKVTVTLSDMTIQHGKPSVEEECGGGILNYGVLTVDKTAVTANTANGGAGICNSGETLTQALLPGSPAIDAIPMSHCSLTTDQRGAPRPVGLTSDESLCDIGAVEVQGDE